MTVYDAAADPNLIEHWSKTAAMRQRTAKRSKFHVNSNSRTNASQSVSTNAEPEASSVGPEPLAPPTVSIPVADVARDIDLVLWSMKLHKIRRYFHQRFWEDETREAEFSERVEPYPRLETVSEHSWHVADCTMLFGTHFESLNRQRCLELAIIHDKLEIVTGDKNPVGRDGTGSATHAFSKTGRDRKEYSEREALQRYLVSVRSSIRQEVRQLFEESIDGCTAEARFVRAVDKLQAFAFVLLKKRGDFDDKHLNFTLRYTAKAVDYFPGLSAHYNELRTRLIRQVARRRGITVSRMEDSLRTRQLEFSFDGE